METRVEKNMKPFKPGQENLNVIRVRITGYRTRPNEYFPAGTVGLMEVIETSVDFDVIQARFYPEGSIGFGLVTWPLFETVKDLDDPDAGIDEKAELPEFHDDRPNSYDMDGVEQ